MLGHITGRNSQVVLMVKNLPANAGDICKDVGLIPGSGRSPGGDHFFFHLLSKIRINEKK